MIEITNYKDAYESIIKSLNLNPRVNCWYRESCATYPHCNTYRPGGCDGCFSKYKLKSD